MQETASRSEPLEIEAVAEFATCPHCYEAIAFEVVLCTECQSSVGFPNVRASVTPEQLSALDRRYLAAIDAGREAGHLDEIMAFEKKVELHSHAVINRRPDSLASMLASEHDISHNYYRQIDAGLRRGHSDKWNSARVLVDEIVFPGYFENIRFAALSLTNTGLTSYGSCSIVLKDKMIENRSSVFETNTLLWIDATIEEKTTIFSLRDFPAGYRAPWADRGRLAVAKLFSKILRGEGTDEDILMQKSNTTAGDDFVEVHIWGAITKNSVARITIPRRENVTKKEKIYIDVILDRFESATWSKVSWSTA